MANNQLKLYNWSKNGDYVGSLGALARGGNPDEPLISLWNDIDAIVSIGYASTTGKTIPSYMEFDKYGVGGNDIEFPIRVLENMACHNNMTCHGTLKAFLSEFGVTKIDVINFVKGTKMDDATFTDNSTALYIDGNLRVSGQINGVSNKISNLENTLLQQEGLI